VEELMAFSMAATVCSWHTNIRNCLLLLQLQHQHSVLILVQRNIDFILKDCIQDLERLSRLELLLLWHVIQKCGESELGPERTDGSKAVTSKV
jgi:hypothetical protein